MVRTLVLLLLVSPLTGCAWAGAVSTPFTPYSCYGGMKHEPVFIKSVGPLGVIDIPFTFVADTLSLPFCGY